MLKVGDIVCASEDSLDEVIFLFKTEKGYFCTITTEDKVNYENNKEFKCKCYKDIYILPKYKPYSEPKLEWIDKYVKADWYDEDETEQIIGICKGTDDQWLVEFNDGENTNFKYFFECYKWADGSPCGEEVKQENTLH